MLNRDAILKWLDQKWPQYKRACEICSNINWGISDDLVTPIIFNSGNIAIGGNSYPQLMVICNTCGNTKYFNTVVMGITVPPKGAENAK